jgi:DNA polymerase III delta prime subunit
VIEKEGISCSKDGLEAIVFTADGDMRQALNNLQATHTGFGDVTADSVFKASRALSACTPLYCRLPSLPFSV